MKLFWQNKLRPTYKNITLNLPISDAFVVVCIALVSYARATLRLIIRLGGTYPPI